MKNFPRIGSAAELMELIDEIGFLPLLDSGVYGFSAEEIVDEDCRYVVFSDGGWNWPLWKWKGQIVTEMPCFYGKFFNKKVAGLLQLSKEQVPPPFPRLHRGQHSRHIKDDRQPDYQRVEGCLRL